MAAEYPPGIENRRPRPRREKTGGGALIGAILGGLVNPVGLLLGGALGHGLEMAPPIPLDEALRREFESLGVQLAHLYRRGPFALEVMFDHEGRYWTVEALAPRVKGWKQEALDDWLFGELVDHGLKPWLVSNRSKFL